MLGRKIKEDAGLTAPADLDIGFRCLRLDESNMKPVYYTPDEDPVSRICSRWWTT